MRIVIDMQGAQAANRSGEVGRRTMAFAMALALKKVDHELILVLNGLFPETIEAIRSTFEGILPQENIQIWHTPFPISANQKGNDSRRRAAELLREAFLASLQPDIIHISSLFEGYVDDAITSVGSFDTSSPVSIMVNEEDLSPLLNPVHHFRNHHQLEAFYSKKVEHLKNASLYFVTSGRTYSELAHKLGLVDKEKIIIIGDVGHKDTISKAIAAMKCLQTGCAAQRASLSRPRLAYISPLPPDRTGIADYGIELLPGLAEYYEIEVIVINGIVDDPWINKKLRVRTVDWFTEHVDDFDRILYHFGNSEFHQHMFGLLKEFPGIVVLHDFYLSGIVAHMDVNGFAPGEWAQELYLSHGYWALYERHHAKNIEAVVWKYPCSLSVIKESLGLIVHSPYSLHLAQQWYGWPPEQFSTIPLVRESETKIDRFDARKALGLSNSDFLVCSFGMLGPTKLNHRLIEAWLESDLARESHCHLVFVGENHSGDYGKELELMINKAKKATNIKITGWTQKELFHQYLAAADVAVQLRTLSRGETSAAVLDCMKYGLPTIANANGSIADIDAKYILKLHDTFKNTELIDCLERLWHSQDLRHEYGEHARERIRTIHTTVACAELYAKAIETFYAKAATGLPALIRSLSMNSDLSFLESDVVQLAEALSRNQHSPGRKKQLLLDITSTIRNDLKTGIERVARAWTLALLESPPEGYRPEPVYLDCRNGKWMYRYARQYTINLLSCKFSGFKDEIAEAESGDILLAMDLSGDQLIQAEKSGLFQDWRNQGVKIWGTVFDLLPVRMPEVFPPGSDVGHSKWLSVISSFDGAICISKAVADDLRSWQQESGISRRDRRPFSIGWTHLGADVGKSAPTIGMPAEAKATKIQLRKRMTFLMVGTIEPRKGYLQAIDAFDQLWGKGIDLNLVIVGHEGWKNWVPEDMRRNIPMTIHRLRSHVELNKRLFWLEGISDEYLDEIYATSSCLIAASYGEGFGLPLIEAAQHKIPIIARDIPVFREVAEEHAYYFHGNQPDELAMAILEWIDLHREGKHPTSDKMPWVTWQESAKQLKHALL